ncbi:unnamed protein product [Parnassius apollo]|uniref:(apollo) hypothetical protein n=1 Tax=Parnassius apollo TaxID=110799 RepID=A0A8S3XXH5_PARAO|nr:unnamed protein product [Parnassius apollo]
MQALQALEAMEQLGNAPHRRRKVYQKRYDPFSLPDVEFKKRYRFNKRTASFIIDLVRWFAMLSCISETSLPDGEEYP